MSLGGWLGAITLAVLASAAGCAGPPTPQAQKAQADVNEPNGNSPAGLLPGAIYRGLPDFRLTGALLKAAGYPGPISAERAYQAMLGPAAQRSERQAVSSLYGATAAASFFRTYSYVLARFAAIANAQSFVIPRSPLRGSALALRVIQAGVDRNGAFSTGYLLDRLMTHSTAVEILNQVESSSSFGQSAIDDMNRVGNMYHYELARSLDVAGVKLATSTWTTTSGMRATTDSRGGTQFEYDGTGSKSGNESASLLVNVEPGRTYALSAFVRADKVEAGGFFLIIGWADGTHAYSTFFSSSTSPQRRRTPRWKCPRGVYRVLLLMQVTGATIPEGGRIAFSAPRLETAGSASRAL